MEYKVGHVRSVVEKRENIIGFIGARSIRLPWPSHTKEIGLVPSVSIVDRSKEGKKIELASL